MATPAAVLSILVKAQGVQATQVQMATLDKTARKAGAGLTVVESGAKKSTSSLASLGQAARVSGGLIGAAGLAAGVKIAIGEFREAQKVGAQTNAVIKSTGGAAKVSAAEVAQLTNAISKKAGIDDEAIQKGANLLLTFKNIRNEAGQGRDIFNQATKAAIDLSAAGFGSIESASKQLGKALNDPVKGMTALGRAGVTFSESQKQAITALLDTGRASDRVKAQQIVLREVMSQVGGSAAAQATATDHLMVTLGNLAETAGGTLVPAIDSAAAALDRFIVQMQKGVGAGGAFVDIVKFMAHNFSEFVKHCREDTDLLLGIFTTIVDGIGQVARTLSKIDPTGAMGKVADRAQRASDKINALRETIRPAGHEFDNLNKAADDLGHSLASNFEKGRSGADALGHSITTVNTKFAGLQQAADAALGGLAQAIKKPAGALRGVGDGIGKQAAFSIPGVGSAALMGANSSLSPFARIGAGFGLHVSSGRRPGSITSSGNPSYHGSGEAIDMAGSPAGMMSTFKTLRSKFGSRLAELIYTPGGAGIKNGRPFTYTGQVARDHFDHVHVALDTGAPGVGDGIGRVRRHLMGDGYGKTGLQSLWQRAGGPASAANIAAAVALAESGGNSGATHRNTDGSIDRGLWQINSVHGALSTLNPLANAKAAVKISGGGRNWSPWVTFKTGAYKKFLGKAAAAAKKGGKGAKGSKVTGGQKAIAHGTSGKAGMGFTEQQIAELNAQREYNLAKQAAMAPSASASGDEGDPNQPLIDALNASAEAQIAQAAAIAGLQSEVKRQTDFATSVASTSNFQLTKNLADLLSGQIVGYGVAGRSFTPGTGVEHAY